MAEIGLFEAMYTARALRRFRPEPVPDEVVTKILDAATRAPSGSNEQHWRFIAITDREQRRRVAELYRTAAERAQLKDYVAAKFSGEDRQKRLIGDSALDLAEHMEDAPVLIVACLCPRPSLGKDEEAAQQMTRVNAGSIYPAVQNIILACRGLGLATVLTTLHVIMEDELKAMLKIPPEVSTWALLPIGYPVDKFGPVRRKPVEEVAYRDRWGEPWRS
jgi:nitroreductase